MTPPTWQITPLRAEHSLGVARCHIACWREAYPGIVPAHVLAAFDPHRAAQRWERLAMTDPGNTRIATIDTEVIGFAEVGVPRERHTRPPRELRAIYVRASRYGSGLADELLDAVLSPTTPCALWVFEENHRARAFYRRHGFVPDGRRRVESFTTATEIRMVRHP
ncbi:GNAT family N-acetyltransferase [Nocardia callitridis]|uniref:GNAT family N-acetyltransferase n=1 Tax=Nocardia callitridis TaxID=648753 RepID=A0ABP9KRN4_9NOCA